MKNKILAIFGIGTYILSVISSATDLEGNPSVPNTLILISGIAMAAFVVLAIIRLWRRAKNLSIIFASSAAISLISIALFESIMPVYGSPIIVLMNIAKVIYIVAFIFVIVRLFKIKDEVVNSRID